MKSVLTFVLAVLAAPVVAHTDAGLHLHPHLSDGASAWVPLLLGMVAIVAALVLTARRDTHHARRTRNLRK